MRGYIQIYTGDGKGKTTAALGLALRAAGANLRVFVAQFAKGGHYSELDALKSLAAHITIRQYGTGRFIGKEPDEELIRTTRRGLEEVWEVMTAGTYDVIILDEANIATGFNLFSVDELIALIDAKPAAVELVITGRGADPRIVEKADLVTEMKEIKHYFRAGVEARIGIEK